MSSVKGERVGRETLIMCGHTQRLRTGKRVTVAGNLHVLHVSGVEYHTHAPSIQRIVG